MKAKQDEFVASSKLKQENARWVNILALTQYAFLINQTLSVTDKERFCHNEEKETHFICSCTQALFQDETNPNLLCNPT